MKHNFIELHWLSPQLSPEQQSLYMTVASFNTHRALFSWCCWSWPWNLIFPYVWLFWCPEQSACCTGGRRVTNRWVLDSHEAAQRQLLVFWWKLGRCTEIRRIRPTSSSGAVSLLPVWWLFFQQMHRNARIIINVINVVHTQNVGNSVCIHL